LSSRLILETTSTWHEVIAFYETYGFRFNHHERGECGCESYFTLDIKETHYH